jgi:Thioredoxin-like domain
VSRKQASERLSGVVRQSLMEPRRASCTRVAWLNDIEVDARYRGYRPSLQNLLMPTMPGQLPNVRRNLYSVVIVGDLISPPVAQ